MNRGFNCTMPAEGAYAFGSGVDCPQAKGLLEDDEVSPKGGKGAGWLSWLFDC